MSLYGDRQTDNRKVKIGLVLLKLNDKGLLTFAIEKVQITLSIGFFPPQKLGWMAGFGIYSVYLNLSLDKQ